MSEPLATWQLAKKRFEAKVKNNKNTRKPGSWFTSGTESAIKKVTAVVYLKPPTAYTKAIALRDKLEEKLQKEYDAQEKKNMELVARLGLALRKQLEKEKMPRQQIDLEVLAHQKKALKKFRDQLDVLKVRQELLVDKESKKADEIFDAHIEDLKKEHQTQLTAWRKHMTNYQREIDAAAKSKDYDKEYKEALKILTEGLHEVNEELEDWPNTGWALYFRKV